MTRILDADGNELSEDEIDLDNGTLEDWLYASPEAYETIDNETKFALDEEDYEWVKRYVPLDGDEMAEINTANANAEAQSSLAQTQSDTDDALVVIYKKIQATKDAIEELGGTVKDSSTSSGGMGALGIDLSDPDAICELYARCVMRGTMALEDITNEYTRAKVEGICNTKSASATDE
jgi:hypothetical protein